MSDTVKIILTQAPEFPVRVTNPPAIKVTSQSPVTKIVSVLGSIAVAVTLGSNPPISIRVSENKATQVSVSEEVTQVVTVLEGGGGGSSGAPSGVLLIDPVVANRTVPSPMIFVQHNMILTGELILEGDSELLVI